MSGKRWSSSRVLAFGLPFQPQGMPLHSCPRPTPCPTAKRFRRSTLSVRQPPMCSLHGGQPAPSPDCLLASWHAASSTPQVRMDGSLSSATRTASTAQPLLCWWLLAFGCSPLEVPCGTFTASTPWTNLVSPTSMVTTAMSGTGRRS